MGLVSFEVKRLIRRPEWVVLFLVSAVFFYVAEVPSFLASFPEGPTGLARAPLVSLAEWGRMILVFLSSFLGALFGLFVSLMTTGLIHSELTHREVVWSTAGAADYRATASKLIAVSLFATGIIVIGALSAWVNPANREMLTLQGMAYVPLYLGLIWLQVAAWVGGSMFVYHLTHSRWLAIAAMTGLLVLWFVIGLVELGLEPRIGLLHRSLLSWSFLSPYAPLGLVPQMLLLQALGLGCLVVVSLVATHWARRTFPAWKRVRPWLGKTALSVSFLLTVACIAGSAMKMGVQMSARLSPWSSHAFIPEAGAAAWTEDGKLVKSSSLFRMVRLPARDETPAWILEEDSWRRFDGVGSSQSLLLSTAVDHEYPPELEGAVSRLLDRLDPLIERAEAWQETAEVIFLPPNSGVQRMDAHPGIFFIGDVFAVLRSTSACAWALAEFADIAGPDRLYLYLYLLEAFEPADVGFSLERLNALVNGTLTATTGFPRLTETQPMWHWDRDWGVAEAERILAYWEQGEREGHEVVIRMLVEGGTE